MGSVVDFVPKAERAIDPPRPAVDIASVSSTMALQLRTIEVCSRSFERDMKTIESIACSTRNPELRRRLLREINRLQTQLSLALTAASSAKRSVQEADSEAVREA